jgi:hypothetical protein
VTRKPYSSVPQQGQDASTYYGQPATGTIGQDLPKEILRVERDWILGDVCQCVLLTYVRMYSI